MEREEISIPVGQDHSFAVAGAEFTSSLITQIQNLLFVSL